MNEISYSGNDSPASGLRPPASTARVDIILMCVVFAVAFTLRFIYVLQIYSNPFFAHPVIDARMYSLWAESISRGSWLWNEIPFQAPGYAYFLAYNFMIFGMNYLMPIMLQALFGSLVCVFVYLITRRLLERQGRVVAALAGLGAAAYWPLIYHDGQLISESPAIFLAYAGILAIVKARGVCEDVELRRLQVAPAVDRAESGETEERSETGAESESAAEERAGARAEARARAGEGEGADRSARPLTLAYWFFGGLLLGLSAATRPNITPFLPFALLWALGFPRIVSKETGRAMRLGAYRVVAALTLAAGILIPTGVITLRNYQVSGEFAPLQWNTSINFYIGNNAKATGTPSVREGADFNRLRAWPASEGRVGQIEEARFFREKAFEYIKETPSDWLRLVLKKLVIAWNSFEIGDIQDIYYWKAWASVLRLPLPGFDVVGPLALLGLIVFVREWRRLFLPYALVATTGAGLLLFTVSARYRLMAIPVTVCFAAAALVRIGRWAGERRWIRFALGLVVLAGATVFVNCDFYDLQAEPQIFRTHYHLGMVCVESGKTETDPERYRQQMALAIAEFKKELEQGPGDPDVLYALGTTCLAVNAYDPAYTALKEAMDNQPDRAEVYVAMGNLYEKMRRLPNAEGEYLEAISLDPNCFEAYNNLGYVMVLQGKPEDQEEAIGYLMKAAELKPASPDPFNNLGLAYMGLKKYDDAVAMFQRAVERDLFAPSTHYNLALAYFMQGRLVESKVEAGIAQSLGHPRAEALLRKITRER
ncbi:MAG: tetratricopeptide repeat protein [Planctomycetota bacterium]|nr:tetratricopeptide repeat protein [Planctomycetota bacterium]